MHKKNQPIKSQNKEKKKKPIEQKTQQYFFLLFGGEKKKNRKSGLTHEAEMEKNVKAKSQIHSNSGRNEHKDEKKTQRMKQKPIKYRDTCSV